MPMSWWAAVYSALLKEDGDFLLLEDGSKIVTEASSTTASWRATQDLWVWDGSWKSILNGWIYDGSNWRIGYIENAMSLDSFDVFDFGGGTLGFSWTYTGSRPGDWRLYIDESTDSGSTWTNIADFDLTVSPQNLTQSASDWYRARLVFASDTLYQATGSPIVKQPPYPT